MRKLTVVFELREAKLHGCEVVCCEDLSDVVSGSLWRGRQKFVDSLVCFQASP